RTKGRERSMDASESDRSDPAEPWWNEARQRRALRWLVALATAVVISQWVRIVLRPEGDFTLHWIFGRRFVLGGFLYASGMHRPYPPAWALAATPLTALPMATMRALVYPLGLLPL